MRSLIGAILCFAAFSASAQLYRWTDPSGKVHFSDTPPPADARNVQKKAAAVPGNAGTPVEPFALRQARENFPVTLYSTPGCEPCDEARKLLDSRGVPFEEVIVTESANLAELKKAVGSNSVPALMVGSSAQNGFEAGAYHQALDAAGYPKTGVLPARKQAEPKSR
jgi:glutaredoxin